jgi:hypothetical protein
VKWLLRVYPPAWRQRYQEEMLALLEEHQVTRRTRVDLLLGALDAWMNPQVMGPKRLSTAEQALYLRRAHRTIFWAFPLFIAGFMLALDGVDDALFPLAIAVGLSRYEVSSKLLRYALAPIGCTVAAMAAHALFFAGWAFLVWNVSAQTVPQLAQAEDCPLFSGGSRHLRLLVGILWMAWMTGCAIWSFVRALGALTRPEAPAV